MPAQHRVVCTYGMQKKSDLPQNSPRQSMLDERTMSKYKSNETFDCDNRETFLLAFIRRSHGSMQAEIK
jgi:hypothetical protein